MEMLQNAIGWFEIPVTDFERAKKFYSAIYDYEMPEQMMGPNRMGFLLFNMNDGGIGGAIVKGSGYVPSETGVKIYLNAGADLSTVLNRVEAAGGKVTVSKTEVAPGMGYFGAFIDTEGNPVCLTSKS